jgi:general secretion pathway protein F
LPKASNARTKLDADGKPPEGLIEADNAKAARTQLRAQALVPLAVAPVAAGRHRQHQRHTLLAAGVRQHRPGGVDAAAGRPGGLGPAAGARAHRLADEAEDSPPARAAGPPAQSEVNAGSSFARALGTAPREFDEVYRAVVAAGEQSGALGVVLERLADDLEQRQRCAPSCWARCCTRPSCR